MFPSTFNYIYWMFSYDFTSKYHLISFAILIIQYYDVTSHLYGALFFEETLPEHSPRLKKLRLKIDFGFIWVSISLVSILEDRPYACIPDQFIGITNSSNSSLGLLFYETSTLVVKL